MRRLVKTVIPFVTIGVLAALSPAPAGAGPALVPQAIPRVTKTISLKSPGTLGSTWNRIARIGYGSATARLGTSPGGDGGGILWGPSYGTEVPDKTWWYADAAKKRLAHYSDSGKYLGQVKLPAKYLHQGIYFQWQNPQPLADGTVVLTSTTIGSPGLLLLSPKKTLKRVPMDRFVAVVISDGHRLYGFDETNKKVKLAPRTGAVTTVSAFVGQGGRSFAITVGAGYLRITRPGVNLRVNLVSTSHPTLTVHPSIQVAMGSTGKLWVLVNGFVEVAADDVRTVVGLFNINLDGAVSAVSRLRDPTSPADPGDGYNLGVRKGSTRPWLMFIDPDAVRVYRKE